jgi:hypothetical protein
MPGMTGTSTPLLGGVSRRLGLAAAGLDSLAPRSIRHWIEGVRGGRLDPAETAAATTFVFRMWVVALFLKALGSGWDVAWHFRFIRDDFAPPHNINLVGDGIAIALVLFHWYTRFAVDRLALRLMTSGASLFVLSAPVDVINHRINGLDITSWSITHFGLYVGTGIMVAGVIRAFTLHPAGRSDRTFLLGAYWFFFLENVWFPNQHQEYGVEEIASWDRGHPYAEQSLLDFAANQIGRPVDRVSLVAFSLPVPAWVYPLWIVAAAGITLMVARRSVGLRWTATVLGLAYLAWRCVLFPLFVVTGFPTSAVPFVVVAAGLAVDLVSRAKLPWLAEAAAGAALVTALVYAGLFLQSEVLVAPPVSYWSAPVAAVVLFVLWAGVRRGASLLEGAPLRASSPSTGDGSGDSVAQHGREELGTPVKE